MFSFFVPVLLLEDIHRIRGTANLLLSPGCVQLQIYADTNCPNSELDHSLSWFWRTKAVGFACKWENDLLLRSDWPS